jgi:hypothetical protein
MNIVGKPVTMTRFREKSGQGLEDIFALLSSSIFPLIMDFATGGLVPHYIPFGVWLDLIKAHRDWIHVGQFVMPTAANRIEYMQFVNSNLSKQVEYIILDNIGNLVSMNVAGRSRTVGDIEFKSGEIESIKIQARNALRQELGKEFELFEPLYFQKDHNRITGAIVPDFTIISEELLRFMQKNPNMQQYLHWRKFEEMLATVFKNLGYDVELGPGSGDGGIDLRLIQRSDIGTVLTLVQAKRYSENNTINLQPIQALFGALNDEGATNAVLVTTSRFDPAAHRFAEKNRYRLELADPITIQRWIRMGLARKR